MNTLIALYKKIPKEISLYSVAQITTLVLGFIGFSYISRYLGPINLGLFSFVQNFIGVFLSFVNGLELYYTWQLAKSGSAIEDAKIFFGHKLHLTLTITALAIGTAFFTLPLDVALLCVMISLPLFLHSMTAFTLYSNAHNNARIYARSQIVAAILLLIARIILVSIKADLIYIVLLSSLDLILTGAGIAWYYLSQKDWRKEFISHSFPTYKSTLSLMYTIRFSILAFVAWQLILRIDQLILATFAGAYTLGVYAAAAKIAEVPNFIAGILYIYTIPKFGLEVKKLHTDERSFFQIYKKIIYSYLGVSLFIMIGIIIFAPFAVTLLFGNQFIESIAILRIYALSIPPLFLLYFFFSLYGSMERYKIQTAIFSIGVIVNIIVIKIGYAYFGVRGVAAASFISYSLLVCAFSYFHKRKIPEKVEDKVML